ncbi:MAG: AAA family ATPase [Oscillospiraceae bacterium]
MEYWPLFALIALAFVIYSIYEFVSKNKKLENRLKNKFGKAPSTKYKCASPSLLWEELRASGSIGSYVDDTTWRDLDLEDVYERIDNCDTTIGQEYLYANLHVLQEDDKFLLQREQLINAFKQEDIRLATQKILAKLGKRTGQSLAALLFEPDLFALVNPKQYIFFAVLPLIMACVLPFSLKAGFMLIMAAFIINMCIFNKAKKELESNLETISYLMCAVKTGEKLCEQLKNTCPQYCQKLDAALSICKKFRFGAAVLSVSPQTDADVIVYFFGMLTLQPIIQYNKSINIVKEHQAQISDIYTLLGEIDISICLLSYRASLEQYTIPKATDAVKLKFTDITHPLLNGAVPNSATIESNWLLTGSNASGKSTFIKAVALNIIMAQTIFTCTAAEAALKFCKVVTSMAVADNVTSGESYFVAEIKSMLRIVQSAQTNKPCYCFIDEILKGTNTVERIAASQAVLQFITGQDNCLCIAATHDIELTQMLAQFYTNMHFSEKITQNGVSFDYLLKCGASDTRNAIRLLEYYKFPAEIINKANEIADNNGETNICGSIALD